MLKQIFKPIKLLKKYFQQFLIVIFFVIFFVILRFPWSYLINKVVNKATQPIPFHISFENSDLNFLPLSLKIENIKIDSPKLVQPIHLDAAYFAPSFLKWLSFRQGWKISFVKDDLTLSIILSSFSVKKNERSRPYISVKIQAPILNMSVLESLSSDLNISGNLDVNIKAEGPRSDITEGKSSILISGQRFKLLESSLNSTLGPVRFPNIDWKSLSLKMFISKNKLEIQKLQLGEDDDAFFVQLRGNMDIKINRGRLRFGSYDFQLMAETAKSFKFPLFDLMLDSTKTETIKGYRYLARIVGQGSRSPNIEKLSDF